MLIKTAGDISQCKDVDENSRLDVVEEKEFGSSPDDQVIPERKNFHWLQSPHNYTNSSNVRTYTVVQEVKKNDNKK